MDDGKPLYSIAHPIPTLKARMASYQPYYTWRLRRKLEKSARRLQQLMRANYVRLVGDH